MKDVINENIKTRNDGVRVEISDNSTQINIDRRLSEKDANKLLDFIESLITNSPEKQAQIENAAEKSKNNGNFDFEKKLDKEYIREVYKYISSLDRNSPNYRKRNIHDNEGKPNGTSS